MRPLARRTPPSRHAVGLLLLALGTVLVARVVLTTRQLPWLKARVAAVRAERSGAAPQPPSMHDLREVAWSVTRTSRLVPGATCLTQALAGDWLLARRGRDAEIRLSLPAGTDDGFRPHAWLLGNDTIILGGTREEFARHRPFRPATIARRGYPGAPE